MCLVPTLGLRCQELQQGRDVWCPFLGPSVKMELNTEEMLKKHVRINCVDE